MDFFSIFSLLGLFSAFFTSLRHIMLTKAIVKLGRNAHKDMIDKLIKVLVKLFMKLSQEAKFIIDYQKI